MMDNPFYKDKSNIRNIVLAVVLAVTATAFTLCMCDPGVIRYGQVVAEKLIPATGGMLCVTSSLGAMFRVFESTIGTVANRMIGGYGKVSARVKNYTTLNIALLAATPIPMVGAIYNGVFAGYKVTDNIIDTLS